MKEVLKYTLSLSFGKKHDWLTGLLEKELLYYILLRYGVLKNIVDGPVMVEEDGSRE